MSNQFIDSRGGQQQPADVVIGIPAYNEEEAIVDVVREARNAADTVIVVDDGSDDHTAALAKQGGAVVHSHDGNRGYGAALESLFRAASDREADHLVIVDADGQHDPRDAPNLVATQRSSNAEIVIGSRFVGGSQSKTPLYRRVGLAVINATVGMCLRLGYSSQRVRDTQSGFRVYDSDAIELLAHNSDLSDGMDASVDILFHAADEDFEFVEVPVDVTYDVAEANTHNPVVHGAVLVQSVFERVLSERPFRLLGAPGAVSLLVGIALAGASITGLSPLQTIPGLVVLLLLAMGGGLTGAALAVNSARSRGE